MSQNLSDDEVGYQYDLRQETEFEKLEDDYKNENNFEDELLLEEEEDNQIIQKNLA